MNAVAADSLAACSSGYPPGSQQTSHPSGGRSLANGEKRMISAPAARQPSIRWA